MKEIPFVKMAVNELCPEGREITTRTRCEETLKFASSLALNANRTVREVRYPKAPLQCSVSAKVGSSHVGWVHFNKNHNTTNTRLFSGEFVMICEAGNIVSCTETKYLS